MLTDYRSCVLGTAIVGLLLVSSSDAVAMDGERLATLVKKSPAYLTTTTLRRASGVALRAIRSVGGRMHASRRSPTLGLKRHKTSDVHEKTSDVHEKTSDVRGKPRRSGKLAATLALFLGLVPLSAPALDVTVDANQPELFKGGTDAEGKPTGLYNVPDVREGLFDPATGDFTASPNPAQHDLLGYVYHIESSATGPAPCHEEHSAPPSPYEPYGTHFSGGVEFVFPSSFDFKPYADQAKGERHFSWTLSNLPEGKWSAIRVAGVYTLGAGGALVPDPATGQDVFLPGGSVASSAYSEGCVRVH